jgi:hypothetical protein
MKIQIDTDAATLSVEGADGLRRDLPLSRARLSRKSRASG